MAANDETFTLPCSLLQLAYYACNDKEQKWYDKMRVTPADVESCCKSLIRIVELNSDVKRFQPLGDRRNMYAKVLPIIKSQCSQDYVINTICETAASYGHIDCMKFARAIGFPLFYLHEENNTACDMAAESGNLECLKYAHMSGSPWTATTSSIAARFGHLDCLIFLHENGCSWDERTCTYAAQNGQMDCLIYARQNGCPWNTNTCSEAARNGQLRCLMYCRENGCPWDFKTCENAFSRGKLKCFRYAVNNGCPSKDLEFYMDILLANPLLPFPQNRYDRLYGAEED